MPRKADQDQDRPEPGAASSGGRTAAVALASNAAIAAAKLLAWLVTGSASMLAETVHSTADTGNQGLMLFGQRRARRRADRAHPFGYSRLRYFWAFVVSVVLFTVGGVASVLEGVGKLRNPHEVGSLSWAVGVLVAGVVFESISFANAVRNANRVRGRRSWPRFVADAEEPELPVVLLEDLAALIGLFVALAGVVLARLTGEPRWDAAGSVVIGALLMVVAFVLGREMKGMLVGESASEEVVDRIRRTLGGSPGILGVEELRTERLGPETLLVGARVSVDEQKTAGETTATLGEAKEGLRRCLPSARFVYLEPVGRSDRPASRVPDGDDAVGQAV